MAFWQASWNRGARASFCARKMGGRLSWSDGVTANRVGRDYTKPSWYRLLTPSPTTEPNRNEANMLIFMHYLMVHIVPRPRLAQDRCYINTSSMVRAR